MTTTTSTKLYCIETSDSRKHRPCGRRAVVEIRQADGRWRPFCGRCERYYAPSLERRPVPVEVES